MSNLVAQERYKIDIDEQREFEVHLIPINDGHRWDVWLNDGTSDFSGIQLALTGPREDALLAAIHVVEQVSLLLRQKLTFPI